MDYYERWFGARRDDWEIVRPWQRLAQVWTMSAEQNSKPAVRVDIFLTLAASGTYRGIITTSVEPPGR